MRPGWSVSGSQNTFPLSRNTKLILRRSPHLTDAMLEQIGLPVGPRAKVLGAIERLHALQQAARGEIGATPGERRQITVLFCDIVNSTKLASQLDPEDFGRWIHAYQRACAAVVLRYEGHVAQYLGDGVEVLFGWPAGQEDAAERAIRAGLDIIEAIKTLNMSEPISVRVGIATGIGVVGLPNSWSATGRWVKCFTSPLDCKISHCRTRS